MGTSTLKVWTDGNIQAIMSNIRTPSANQKTGDMVQVTIIDADKKPTQAIKDRTDSTYCGDCPLRSGVGCYVNPVPYNSVYKAVDGANVAPVPDINKPVRYGAYGDPAFIPLDKLDTWSHRIPAHTGYTHQWHKVDRDYSRYFMASIDGISDRTREEAKDLGYRTFRILKPGETTAPGEIICPNYTTGVQCRDCKLCAGTASGGKDIAIPVHGPANKVKAFS